MTADVQQNGEEIARMHANMQTNKHATAQVSNQANVQKRMRAFLHIKASDGFSFRYPPELLELLDDTLYHIRKTHKVKVTKNSVAVAALTYLLSEFEADGENSILYHWIIAAKK